MAYELLIIVLLIMILYELERRNKGGDEVKFEFKHLFFDILLPLLIIICSLAFLLYFIFMTLIAP